ncbi:sugar kinase [Pasteurellaceae bacterium USgator11]|nr:sugar kinase [Pasteurellaceae bacterium USgator41]TNG97242.1 sugar kinase [Pasteurellaceae bacterium UScroc12]TNG99820.1 sugar kinase [Pasteurellaceae bacterium UScroc31]TNH01077.1 sugar kinase [Pasteurellaceae bacterium USgator11]
MKKIAVIGECMIELLLKENDPKLAFGGDTLNTAVYLSRLLDHRHFSVSYVTALGQDPFSQQMLAQWQQEKIETDLVQQRADKLPGLYSIVTDQQGERSFYYWRNDSAARYWLQGEQSDVVLSRLQAFDYCYLSGISVAILDGASLEKLYALLRQIKANGGKVIFDNNYRPCLWQDGDAARQVYQKILAFTDIAFLTLEDETALWQESAVEAVIARTQSYGVAEIVIKRGAESCIVATGAKRFEIAANKIAAEKVIDTTAAGDSFSAGYLAARLYGAEVESAVRQGHRLAGTVIQHRGAIIALAAMPLK